MTDLLLIGTSLAAGLACSPAARQAEPGHGSGGWTAVERGWTALATAAFVYCAQHSLRILTPFDSSDEGSFLHWMELRMGALAVVMGVLLWAAGAVPTLAAILRAVPLSARLEAAASLLTICFVAFLVHNVTAPSFLVDLPVWGLLWLATFAAGGALAVAALLLAVAWPRAGAEPVIALGLFALSVGAMTTGHDGAGWPAAWVAGWLILGAASFRRMSLVSASQDDARLASIARAVPGPLFVGAMGSVAFAWLILSSATALWVGLVVVALALGRRLRAPSAEGGPGWRDWATRLRAPGVLLTILGIAAFWLVSQTLLIGRADRTTPEMAFAVRDFYPQALSGFRIDVVLEVSTDLFDLSCRNPVAVTAVISGTPEMWKRVSGPLDDIAHMGIAVASTDAVRELQAGLATDPAAPINPLLEAPDPDPRPPADPTVKATFRRQDPSGLPYGGFPGLTGSGSPDTATHTVSGSIQDWRSSWIPIVVRFQADWVKRRTLGSCYVLLPELTGTPWSALSAAVKASGHGADVADEEAAKRVAASHGYISLSTSADIVGEESDPPPAVLASGESSSVWTCSSSPHALSAGRPDLPRSPSGTGLALPNDQRLRDESGSKCGGFAVLSTAPSQLLRELSLITIAVLISMIIEIAYSEVRWRWP